MSRRSRNALYDKILTTQDLNANLKLALADSIILATARASGATVWTQDEDFEGIEDVEYRPHRG